MGGTGESPNRGAKVQNRRVRAVIESTAALIGSVPDALGWMERVVVE